MLGSTSGSASIATNATTNVSAGSPVRVFNMTVTSDGTAGVCTLGNGATVWVNPTHTVNKSVTTDFGPEGILFPSGVRVIADAHATVVILTYRVEL